MSQLSNVPIFISLSSYLNSAKLIELKTAVPSIQSNAWGFERNWRFEGNLASQCFSLTSVNFAGVMKTSFSSLKWFGYSFWNSIASWVGSKKRHLNLPCYFCYLICWNIGSICLMNDRWKVNCTPFKIFFIKVFVRLYSTCNLQKNLQSEPTSANHLHLQPVPTTSTKPQQSATSPNHSYLPINPNRLQSVPAISNYLQTLQPNMFS